jgi:hemerythrin
MPLAWDESLATGSFDIDQQHRKLFAQVAALAHAMKEGKGRQEIHTMLDFLGKYVVQHFRAEEQLMEDLDCPAAAANKEAHAQFLAQFGRLRKRFEGDGAGPTLVLEIYEALSKWLLEHIKGVDLQLRGPIANAKRDVLSTAK